LAGEWVRVPEEEFAQRAPEHEALYACVLADRTLQHHSGDGVSLEDMTPAQRQAWEFYSGNQDFYLVSGQNIQGISIRMAGLTPKEKDVEDVRKRWPHHKLIPLELCPWNGVSDKRSEFDFPEDMWLDTDNPIDPQSLIVAQNVQRQRDMWLAQLASSQQDGQVPGSINGASFQEFCTQAVFREVLGQEQTILREEWNRDNGLQDPYDDIDGNIAWYKTMREKLAEIWDEKLVEETLVEWRIPHNDMARGSLDQTNGSGWVFVLPKFNKDGTHPPLGPRDKPWSNEWIAELKSRNTR